MECEALQFSKQPDTRHQKSPHGSKQGDPSLRAPLTRNAGRLRRSQITPASASFFVRAIRFHKDKNELTQSLTASATLPQGLAAAFTLYIHINQFRSCSTPPPSSIHLADASYPSWWNCSGGHTRPRARSPGISLIFS